MLLMAENRFSAIALSPVAFPIVQGGFFGRPLWLSAMIKLNELNK